MPYPRTIGSGLGAAHGHKSISKPYPFGSDIHGYPCPWIKLPSLPTHAPLPPPSLSGIRKGKRLEPVRRPNFAPARGPRWLTRTRKQPPRVRRVYDGSRTTFPLLPPPAHPSQLCSSTQPSQAARNLQKLSSAASARVRRRATPPLLHGRRAPLPSSSSICIPASSPRPWPSTPLGSQPWPPPNYNFESPPVKLRKHLSGCCNQSCKPTTTGHTLDGEDGAALLLAKN